MRAVEPYGCAYECARQSIRGNNTHAREGDEERGSQLTFRVVGDCQVPRRGRVTSVGGPRCVAGVESAREGLARLGERGLSDGVVRPRGVEDEGDDGAVGGAHGARGEKKLLVSAPVVPDVDLVRGVT